MYMCVTFNRVCLCSIVWSTQKIKMWNKRTENMAPWRIESSPACKSGSHKMVTRIFFFRTRPMAGRQNKEYNWRKYPIDDEKSARKYRSKKMPVKHGKHTKNKIHRKGHVAIPMLVHVVRRSSHITAYPLLRVFYTQKVSNSSLHDVTLKWTHFPNWQLQLAIFEPFSRLKQMASIELLSEFPILLVNMSEMIRMQLRGRLIYNEQAFFQWEKKWNVPYWP